MPLSCSKFVNARDGLVGCPVTHDGWVPTAVSEVTLRAGPDGPDGLKRRLVMLVAFDATRIR